MKFWEEITSHQSLFIESFHKKKGKDISLILAWLWQFYSQNINLYQATILIKFKFRIKRYEDFKNFKHRIIIATDIFGRGIDIEKINVVFNFDMPSDSDQYLHRVCRAGRFGTKGLAISFISKPEEQEVLDQIQKRFEVKIEELPTTIDVSTYSKLLLSITLSLVNNWVNLIIIAYFQIINCNTKMIFVIKVIAL